MLFKDTTGTYAYKGQGGQTEALIGQSLAIDGYFKVGEKTIVVPGAESGNTIYSDGDLPQDRVHAGNYPIIRSKTKAAAMSGGGGLPTGKIAVFANSDGDIMPQLEKQPMDETDPEYGP